MEQINKVFKTKESEINFGIDMSIFSTVQVDEEMFESKEIFISKLKNRMLEEIDESFNRMFREDVKGDFDKVIPYWSLIEFKVEDYETGETTDILGEYKKDNKDFFENVVFVNLIKNKNEEGK